MHIELIGSTSAGKTTLATKMVAEGIRNGMDISLSDDFILEQLHMSWIKNDFIRRRLVELVAFAIYLNRWSRYQEFARFVIQEGSSHRGSWLYKFNRIRNVLRKVGIFEFVSQRSGAGQIVLADNEGILQGVHNLFVHQNGHADLQKISRYVDLVPLPDMVLYLQQDETVLVARTLKRGHARVGGSSPDKVAHFIRQAAAVFDELIAAPKVQERLLILDGMLEVRTAAERLLSHDFHRVRTLVGQGNK